MPAYNLDVGSKQIFITKSTWSHDHIPPFALLRFPYWYLIYSHWQIVLLFMMYASL